MLAFLCFLPALLIQLSPVSAGSPGPIGSNNARAAPLGASERPVWGARARTGAGGSLLKHRVAPELPAAHARTVYAQASTTPPSGWS